MDKFVLPKIFAPNFSSSRDSRTIAALALVKGDSQSTTCRVQPDGTILFENPEPQPAELKSRPSRARLACSLSMISAISKVMTQEQDKYPFSQYASPILSRGVLKNCGFIPESAPRDCGPSQLTREWARDCFP